MNVAEARRVAPARRGVSVVVCCYNSTPRLGPTLEHLARQQVPAGLAWEVVVVDNASTDATGEFARQCWRGNDLPALRVVREERPGLSAARFRGLREASYEFVSFVDDDNWVCPEWVQRADEIMVGQPEVGACGGYNSPAFEGEAPSWFPQFQKRYAVGAQAAAPGDVTNKEGVLWGAGLVVRRSALLSLVALGFQPLTSDRRGKTLSSGGDYEICFALRLAGYRLVYDPRLHARHFLPQDRLRWSYLRRLARGSGASRVHRDPYLFLINPWHRAQEPRWRTWKGQVTACIRALSAHPLRTMRSLLTSGEGEPDVLDFEATLGRLETILRERSLYDARVRHCQHLWADRTPSVALQDPGTDRTPPTDGPSTEET